MPRLALPPAGLPAPALEDDGICGDDGAVPDDAAPLPAPVADFPEAIADAPPPPAGPESSNHPSSPSSVAGSRVRLKHFRGNVICISFEPFRVWRRGRRIRKRTVHNAGWE
eukprot:8446991-Pyramimonas_sp.AAC.1